MKEDLVELSKSRHDSVGVLGNKIRRISVCYSHKSTSFVVNRNDWWGI
jgi:hypothetical protein